MTSQTHTPDSTPLPHPTPTSTPFPIPNPPKQKHITILGAGITALQTALTLLTSPSSKDFRITLIAQHLPSDRSPEYTSPWAGGHWRSHASIKAEDERVRKWDARTYEAWSRLLEGEDGVGKEESTVKERMEAREKRMGLGFRGSANFWGEENEETRDGGEGIWWRKGVVGDFQVLSRDQFPSNKVESDGADKKEEKNLVFGVGYKSICFDPPIYLAYLFERIQSLGATIIKSHLDIKHALSGVIASANYLLRQKGMQKMDLFINCAGLSARHFLPPSETQKLFPIRGQTLLIKGSAKTARTITNLPNVDCSELLYVIPRPGSNTTILGGCKQVGNFDPEIDEGLSQKILERVREWGLAEEAKGEDGKYEVLSTQVGFRPGRRGGPRIGVEEEKVDGVWVVHSFGHAGGGYQNSVGCAEEVTGLVEGLLCVDNNM